MLPDDLPSDIASDAPLSPSLARAQRLSHFVPQVVVRFTYLSGTSTPVWLYDSPEEAWRAPFYLGATIELQVVWGLDGWTVPSMTTSPRTWGAP